ncbi:MAG TPA: alpha/beta hydrolase [Candidatus Acidoferrales bacterium]|nr:alpha/beta hydrolase [Candidatus Acidoferrales bacterium]
MIRFALSVCLLGSALCAQDRGPADLLKLPVSPGARRIAYGTDPLQFGELRVPGGRGPYPVVAIVHGGCWVSKLGNLDERAVALDLLRPMAEELTNNGIATWNLEYRRVGNAGGGWPGTFEDVARGTDYLRKIADENRLDLTRVVAIGHSSGGHLALWLAARPKLSPASELYAKDPLRIKGVVDLDGPGDLKATLPMQQSVCGAPVITQLLGGTPEERPERYREASPIEMLPLGIPQEFFAGRMFAPQAPAYEEAAKRAGDAVNAVVLSQAGHFVFIDPGSAVWPQVVQRTRALLGLSR